MGQSYRIRTELGVNKSINVQLDQEFEFLEILSLKLQQEDIYTKSCAEYGVVVGRVTANNGFGIPNARVSIFIPIDSIDESNPIISSIYPYKSPSDKNEDGYRYNLLPYEKSYSTHAATGTLPSRLDVLTGGTAIEIYDKYYKFSVKTNESGDYMIMGVPQGERTIVMDVDLSDIGEFSLTPQDLIRIGLATESQVAGGRFRTSNDLNSLPQIINLVKNLEVSPLWGDPELCTIAINRVDFDLRDDANVDIQPTSVFMGSIYSTADTYRIRPNARPADDMGNLCALVAGPGQILAIRQTIYQDSEGNPVLEQHQLEQSGNIIDGNGVWLTELPMNLDYFITNEFGEKVLSNDPTIGIPTKAKYRFKIKWQQSPGLTEQVRRPYYLVPNIKEYGWGGGAVNDVVKQQSSYYFGLAWSGYTNGFLPGNQKNNRLNEIINCEDTFYEFQFNKVYTIAGLIDEFKNGGRGNFIGIKEIDSPDCANTINKFPVNDGFKNFDLIYFIFAIILQIIQILGIPLLIVFHFLAFLWNNFAVLILAFLIGLLVKAAVQQGILVIAAIAGSAAFGATVAMIAPHALLAILYSVSAIFLAINFRNIVNYTFGRLKLPMMTYPDCQSCECDPETTAPGGGDQESAPPSGLLTQLSNGGLYIDNLEVNFFNPNTDNEDNAQLSAVTISQSISGRFSRKTPTIYKSTFSEPFTFPNDYGQGFGSKLVAAGITLPPGERVNKYNTRKKYFDNVNKISVTFNYPLNLGKKHYDNTLTVLAVQALEPGTLLTFVDPLKTKDVNFLWTGTTSIGANKLTGINGIIQNNQFNADVIYAKTQTTSDMVSYIIPSGDSTCFLSITFDVVSTGTTTYFSCANNKVTVTATTIGTKSINNENGIDITTLGGTAEISGITYGPACKRYIYPSDLEYYQVLTAITINTKVQPGTGKIIYSLPGQVLDNNNNPDPTKGFWNDLIADNKGFLLGNIPGDEGFERFGYIDGSDYVDKGFATDDVYQRAIPPNNPNFSFPTSILDGFNEQVVLILQRGVDPYSPKLPNSYGIGRILGHSSENAVIISGMTRMNTPIQPLPPTSTISVQNHKNVNEIFSGSRFYTPGIPNNIIPNASSTPGLAFSSYTTSNVGYYGALDGRYLRPPSTLQITSVLNQVFYGNGNFINSFIQDSLLCNTSSGKRCPTLTTNTPYGINSISVGGPSTMRGVASDTIPNVFAGQSTKQSWKPNINYGGNTTFLNRSTRYLPNEDLSGAAYMFRGPLREFMADYEADSDNYLGYKIGEGQPFNLYFSPLLLPEFTGGTTGPNAGLTISDPTTQMVMRTDRLPSSDGFDVQKRATDFAFLNGSVGLLQQNLSFAVYSTEVGLSFGGPSFSTGAEQVTADIQGQVLQATVFETMNDCEKMVGLDYYEGNGVTFKVKPGALQNDNVDNGCYVMMNRPLLDLPKDLGTFGEWGYRFRFYYGLCRGVLSQSFVNNWVNGSLYMFPMQIDTYFDTNNQPLRPRFAEEIVYFDDKTNNFYYRSSPYSINNSRFVGSPARGAAPVNKDNLLFPTTIVNLGYKDDFYGEVLFDPAAKGYIMKSLSPTTYSDTSDLVNLFVISRITDSGFLTKILSGLNNSLNILFSRKELRIDGDLAQAMSINSEYGVIPFSPQYYSPESGSVVVLDGPTMGVFFSSTTIDLQNKDFLSPGIINFRSPFNSNVNTYEYGIKSQVVPFYQWDLASTNTIFGTEKNNWRTNAGANSEGIFSKRYQSLNRREPDIYNNPSYFMSSEVESPSVSDIYKRGYIFAVNSNGGYAFSTETLPSNNYVGKIPDKFLVGAPNHFYFGTIQGETALDKFKTKYSVDE